MELVRRLGPLLDPRPKSKMRAAMKKPHAPPSYEGCRLLLRNPTEAAGVQGKEAVVGRDRRIQEHWYRSKKDSNVVFFLLLLLLFLCTRRLGQEPENNNIQSITRYSSVHSNLNEKRVL